MRAWLAAHRHALRSALAQFSRRPAASLFEAAVFGIALALPLGFLVIVENVRALAERHPATPEISVFLVRAATAADIDRIGERLRGIRESESVRFVSRADAAERLRRSVALAEVLNALPENPLPDAFTLRLQEADAGRLEALRADIASWPEVERVQVDSDWARKLDALVRAGRIGALALGLLLGVAMIAVVFNTVRLQMLRSREEIELSRLIGATEAFVRRPYVYFGLLVGFFGSAIALGLLYLALRLAEYEMYYFSTSYGIMVALQPVPGEAAALVLAAGTALGGLTAWLSGSRAFRAR